MLKYAKEPTRLDKAIEEVENLILGEDPETKKYKKLVATLDSLYKLRQGEKPSRVDAKDLLTFFGPLLGILIICVFEAYGHTIVSKSLGFIPKLKG